MSKKRAEVDDGNKPLKAVGSLVLAQFCKGNTVIPKERTLFLQL